MMTRMRDRGSDTRRCSPHLSLPTTTSAIFAPLPHRRSQTRREVAGRHGRCGSDSPLPLGVVVPGRRVRGSQQRRFRGWTTSPVMPRAQSLRGRIPRRARAAERAHHSGTLGHPGGEVERWRGGVHVTGRDGGRNPGEGGRCRGEVNSGSGPPRGEGRSHTRFLHSVCVRSLHSARLRMQM